VLQVRITAVNKVRNYISYAMSLLEEKGHSSVVLKGMGKAINKTVVVGEAGLYARLHARCMHGFRLWRFLILRGTTLWHGLQSGGIQRQLTQNLSSL
jgi:hypothetical protein